MPRLRHRSQGRLDEPPAGDRRPPSPRTSPPHGVCECLVLVGWLVLTAATAIAAAWLLVTLIAN